MRGNKEVILFKDHDGSVDENDHREFAQREKILEPMMIMTKQSARK